MAIDSRRPADVRALGGRSDAWNTRLIAHHDLNGHGDGMQVIKQGRYLYVSHLGRSPMALSILDVADPENPRLLRQLPHEPNTHRHKVQVAGRVLIQNCEEPDDPPAGKDPAPVTGVAVFDLSDPTDPRRVGFHPVGGRGVHRMWYTEPPYAHVAAFMPETEGRGYQIVDVSDPAAPRMAGAWWVPGTRKGDPDPWPRFPGQVDHGVHGVVPHGNRAYVSCMDDGFALLDINNVAAPKLIGRVNWHPPYGGFCHTALPLPGRRLVLGVCESIADDAAEDGDKRIWVIDVREERQPVVIASFPRPRPPKGSPWSDYAERPGRFGPHNVHENRPGSLRSETLIFSTWFNAGLRIVDMTDADRPVEVGYFVPPPAPGRDAPQSNDLYVDTDGLIYMSDRYGGGLDVIEYRPG
jgi:hypothetical protein